MASQLVDKIITEANQWTAEMMFRGRVNVYVEDTATPWKGWVLLQRSYQKEDLTWTDFETVEAYNFPGCHTFVEHETGVKVRLGVADALSGGTPYVRISQ